MFKRGVGVVLVFCWLGLALAAEEFFFPFNEPEELNSFWPAQTARCGTLSDWEIVPAPGASAGKALIVRPNPATNYGSCFNVLLSRDISAKDLVLEVKVKAVKGREDQGGGLLWRAKDADNYYVVRWNPLEDNFRLYYVKRGRRKMLASAYCKADPHVFHLIRVEHRGEVIRCFFDGKLLLEKKDRTFSAAGQIGLWTKADAETLFDDLRVKILP